MPPRPSNPTAPFPASRLGADAEAVAPTLLGRRLRCTRPDGSVTLRITEVEAYHGELDPASHAFRGRTPRNAVMFGPPGFVYVYFTYGMHYCMNVVTGPEGEASAVLLRAGEVVDGLDAARSRRRTARRDRELAQGPARLAQALGVDRALNGASLHGEVFELQQGTPPAPELIRSGPRTGIAQAAEIPWRFWIDADPTVSPYRAHTPRRATRPDDAKR